jgi:hypothetical protein
MSSGLGHANLVPIDVVGFDGDSVPVSMKPGTESTLLVQSKARKGVGVLLTRHTKQPTWCGYETAKRV